MRSLLLSLVALAAIPAWSAGPANGYDQVLYVHLMDEGEVVHTVTVRDRAFLKNPAQTVVMVKGQTLRTALVRDGGPYRLNAHLPSGLCAAEHFVKLIASGKTASGKGAATGTLANLYALEECPGAIMAAGAEAQR